VSAIYIMLPVSLILAGIFLCAYIWSVRSGQYEDTETPALRILPEDRTLSENQSTMESKHQK